MAKIETSAQLADFLWTAPPKGFDVIGFWNDLGVSEEVINHIVMAATATIQKRDHEPGAIMGVIGLTLVVGARLALQSDTLDEEVTI